MNNSYAQNPICIWYVIEIIPKLNEFPRAPVQFSRKGLLEKCTYVHPCCDFVAGTKFGRTLKVVLIEQMSFDKMFGR